MTSESVGGVLGAIVGSAILVVAIAYGPIGQFGLGKPVKIEPRRRRQPRRPSGGRWCGRSAVGISAALWVLLRNTFDRPYFSSTATSMLRQAPALGRPLNGKSASGRALCSVVGILRFFWPVYPPLAAVSELRGIVSAADIRWRHE
jgi:hypothetical protein